MADWFYRIGRALLDQSIRLYYRRIEVASRARIPPSGPAILVANHPNSVADAFLLASQLTARKLNFIAKDTITRAPIVGWFARRFGVVGVARGMDYGRQRDLAHERNQMAISTCQPRLLAGGLVAIFGEGISTDARRLQLIRKGAMRFGFAAEKASGFRLGLLWVPLGITYSAKQRFRSDVLIRVGQPFGVADLDPDPPAHEARVLQAGTERLQRDIEALLVNIEHEELASFIDPLTEFLSGPATTLSARVSTEQSLTRSIEYFNTAEPVRVKDLQRAWRRYHRMLNAVGLTDAIVRQRRPGHLFGQSLVSALKDGALLVPNLFGWANGLVPRWAAYLIGPLGREHPRDAESERRSSVVVAREALWGTLAAWVAAALAFPLQTFMVYRWSSASWGRMAGGIVAGIYLVSLVPSWRLYVRRRDIFRKHLIALRDSLHFLARAVPATRMRRHRRRLALEMRTLIADYERRAPKAAAANLAADRGDPAHLSSE